MGDKFEMHTAFSRDGPEKVYVQHLLKQQGKIINDLLEKKAYFYVCGDAANMAREVNSVLVQIIAEYREKTEAKAEEIVKNMRAANQYQVSAYHFSMRGGFGVFAYQLICRRTSGHKDMTGSWQGYFVNARQRAPDTHYNSRSFGCVGMGWVGDLGIQEFGATCYQQLDRDRFCVAIPTYVSR